MKNAHKCRCGVAIKENFATCDACASVDLVLEENPESLTNLLADALFSAWKNNPYEACRLHDLSGRPGEGGPSPEGWRQGAREFLRYRAELLQIREGEKRKYPER